MNTRIILTLIGILTLLSCTREIKTIELNKSEKDNLAQYFNSEVNEFTSSFNNREYESYLSKLPQEIFKLTTREKFLEKLNKLDSSGIDIKTNAVQVENISKILEYNDIKYCKVFYTTNVEMDYGKMKKKLLSQRIKNIEAVEKAIQKMLKKQLISMSQEFGNENVNLDSLHSTITIRASKIIIAIHKKELKEWKYLEYRNENLSFAVPKEVLNQLK